MPRFITKLPDLSKDSPDMAKVLDTSKPVNGAEVVCECYNSVWANKICHVLNVAFGDQNE